MKNEFDEIIQLEEALGKLKDEKTVKEYEGVEETKKLYRALTIASPFFSIFAACVEPIAMFIIVGLLFITFLTMTIVCSNKIKDYKKSISPFFHFCNTFFIYWKQWSNMCIRAVRNNYAFSHFCET